MYFGVHLLQNYAGEEDGPVFTRTQLKQLPDEYQDYTLE